MAEPKVPAGEVTSGRHYSIAHHSISYDISIIKRSASIRHYNLGSSSLTRVSNIIDGAGGYAELSGVRSITSTTIDSSTYALVAARTDNGVQIIRLQSPLTLESTNPNYGFSYTSTIDAESVIAITGLSTYALVVSSYNNGVQIVDITDLSSPTRVSNIIDGAGGYAELSGVRSITSTTIDSSTYALVAARTDNGVQIIRLQSPLTLESTNPNYGYATTGDTLTVGFTIDDTIASHSAQFLIPAQTPSSEITHDESTFSITALNISCHVNCPLYPSRR